MTLIDPPLAQLKSRAQLLKPAIRLGKAGLSPSFLAELEKLLTHQGLVKVRFDGHKEDRKDLSRQLAEATRSKLVLQVGFTATYYRRPPSPPESEN